MRRILTLSFLVLLALGVASQALADEQRIACTFCDGTTHTSAHYACLNCQINPPEWTEDAYAEGSTEPPPVDRDCPECYGPIQADYCTCWSETCKGAYFWWLE